MRKVFNGIAVRIAVCTAAFAAMLVICQMLNAGRGH